MNDYYLITEETKQLLKERTEEKFTELQQEILKQMAREFKLMMGENK